MEDLSNLPDFWIAHPDALAVEIFRKLKEKKPETSGRIMYLIKFFNDPSCEILKNLSNDVRREELKKWLGIEQKDLDLGYVKKTEEWFKENWMEAPARLYNAHAYKVNEAAKFVTDYAVDSFEAMEKYADGVVMFQKLKEVHDKNGLLFKAQDAIKQKHGGGKISPADTGELFEDLE